MLAIVQLRLAVLVRSVDFPRRLPCPYYYRPRRHWQHLQAYYDFDAIGVVAGAVGAVSAAVAGDGAVAATADDYYRDAVGESATIAAFPCVVVNIPSVATMKIRLLHHRTTAIIIIAIIVGGDDRHLPCRSAPIAMLIRFDGGKRHDACPGSRPDSLASHKCSSRC